MITLQSVGLPHAPLLAAVHRVCFAEPWDEAAMIGTLSMPGVDGCLAADSQNPVGFILWRVAADEAEILTFAVLPPWRRQGAGGRLLATAMDQALAAGADRMFLEVAVSNTAALSLYTRRGFQKVGLRKGYYNGGDAHVLERKFQALGGDVVVSEGR